MIRTYRRRRRKHSVVHETSLLVCTFPIRAVLKDMQNAEIGRGMSLDSRNAGLGLGGDVPPRRNADSQFPTKSSLVAPLW